MIKNIVLIGMPGCGKSTIGLELSKKLSMDFIDVDTYIEKNEDMTIGSMFEISEEHFRKVEAKYIERVSRGNSTVIATGGGVIKNEHNMFLLKNKSFIIYINRKTEDIISDIDDSVRPLLKDNKKRLYELYKERHSLYQKYCDIEVLNNSDIDSIVNKILRIIKDLKEFKIMY